MTLRGLCLSLEEAKAHLERLDAVVRDGNDLERTDQVMYLLLTDYLNMVENPYGMCATVTLDLLEHGLGIRTIRYHNLKEVHLNYTDMFNPTPSDRTAFESDIHQTGITWETGCIREMQVVPNTKIATTFAEDITNERIVCQP